MGEEVERVVAGAARLGFGVLEQRAADAAALAVRVDRDVVDQEALLAVGDEHDEPGDLAAALGHGHGVAPDRLPVVLLHRSRRPPDPRHVDAVGSSRDLRQPRRVGRLGGAKRRRIGVGRHLRHHRSANQADART